MRGIMYEVNFQCDGCGIHASLKCVGTDSTFILPANWRMMDHKHKPGVPRELCPKCFKSAACSELSDADVLELTKQRMDRGD